MTHIVENYLNDIYLLEDIEMINEDLASFLNKFKPDKYKQMAKDLATKVKKKPKEILKIVDKIKAPNVHIDKISKVGARMSSEFKDNYILAKRVLDNSFPQEVNDNMKQVAATYLAIRGTTQKIDYKTMIGKFVQIVRYMVNSSKKILKEVPESTVFEATIGWIVIIFGAWLVITMILAPMTFLGGPWWWGLALVLLVYVCLVVRRTDIYKEWSEIQKQKEIDKLERMGGHYFDPTKSTAGTGQPVSLF